MAVEHQQLENAIAAMLLGSEPPEGRDRLLAHLENCASCRDLAGRLGRAISALPLTAEPVQPPARLHGRVLAAVAAASGVSPVPAGRPRLLFMPERPRLSLRVPALRPGAAVAAALAFVLGIGVAFGVGGARFPNSGGALVTQQVERRPLTGTGEMARVQATAVQLRADGLTLVDFKQLPQLQTGQVYELWLINGDGRTLPAAVFAPDADGSKVVLLTQDLAATKQLVMTVEPGPNGSPVPTQQPQLRGRIAPA